MRDDGAVAGGAGLDDLAREEVGVDEGEGVGVGRERREETVDLPVAMEPVRPMRSILAVTSSLGGGEFWLGRLIWWRGDISG